VYLREFRMLDIKCFEDIQLHFPRDADDYSGWIVVLGGNGVGKSTLLQAIAIALVGPLAGQRLLNPDGWVREERKLGYFSASIVKGEKDIAFGQPRKKPYETSFTVTGRNLVDFRGMPHDQPQLIHTSETKAMKSLMSGPYAARKTGWFSCGYGPFRRLLGGASEESKLMFSAGRESRFVTLFREAAALTQCTEWLSSLYSRSIDPHHPEKEEAKKAFDVVRRVIDDLLPGSVRVCRVTTDRVTFVSGGGAEVAVLDLSDGYRSFLALAIDILRHLEASTDDFGAMFEKEDGDMRVIAEGVILIDEIDAHLHPIWQREIGFLLRQSFPRMQFIVTSHSPFVAQAATDGGLIVLRDIEENGVVRAEYPVDSVRGWRVDQILTSPLFGLSGTRDGDTEDLIREHADLVARRQWKKLNERERKELIQVEERLAQRLTAPGETAEERSLQRDMENYVEDTLKKLGTAK
jgi:AAA domain, putative AbiEii toxin, Type IV TA system/AAA domain